jgi:hypothetical protein
MQRFGIVSYGYEYIYITDEKVGSKVRLLSFREGTDDPTKTMFTDKNSKIICLTQKDNNEFFIMDDTFQTRVF